LKKTSLQLYCACWKNNTPYGAVMEEKTMPKAKRFSMEQILAVQKVLRNLPPKNVGKTRAEAAECLAGSIRKAVEKGHTLQEIRDILASGGIQVPMSRMVALIKKEDGTIQKKEVEPAPGHAEMIDCGLFTIPGKREPD
jgi:hypothetical protein